MTRISVSGGVGAFRQWQHGRMLLTDSSKDLFISIQELIN